MQRRNSDNIVVTVDQERKKSKSKKNGKVDLENIPEEIIFGILANIPAHNLYEFRPVCKLWFKLITDPNFIRQHLSRSEPGLLVQCHVPRFRTIFLEMKGERLRVRYLNLEPPFKTRIHASCNGLILLELEGANETGGLFVANPVTKQCIKLPPRSSTSYSYSYEFAFHPATKEYKVLTLTEQGDNCICEILSLGSDTWRPVFVPQEFRVYNSIYVATKRFLNNVAGFHEDEEAFDEDEEYMYSMDMVHETFHMTRLPVSAYGREDGLFELGDVLALTTRIERTSRYDIWVLKDFHKGDWVKQYSVVLEGVQFAYKHDYNALKPVGSLRKGKVIIFQEHIYFYAADVEVGKEDLETPGS
ncbi:PREDICTED: putative F-box protein At3g52320 isoform X1 [Nelumbo nucifera]|uniref:F-box protein At3g52320 isoform X1 n=1 Tax=Nelumbo nucifera TaxID=4432 RepID=A0A1U8A1I1_NELNU|nr:PREDICTED: putative F-box protein At3g52320 isoform X1 [Nelumbo nucifera]XP_010260852.1 PREDICTED: putative F-box protein At3g52320 isoform X1 [Nelumbo nucifera]